MSDRIFIGGGAGQHRRLLITGWTSAAPGALGLDKAVTSHLDGLPRRKQVPGKQVAPGRARLVRR